MRRLWAGLGMAVALAAITAGGIVITQDDPPAGSQANIWVDSDGGTCTDGALRDYLSSEACSTWDLANDACDNGDVVGVAPGTYTNTPEINGSNSRSSACTFDGFDAVTVRCSASLDCGGDYTWQLGPANGSSGGPSWVTFTRFTVNGQVWVAGGDHITLDDNHGQVSMNVRSTTNFTLSDSTVGPCTSPDESPRTTSCSGVPFSADGTDNTVTISGTTFPGFSLFGDDHGECLHIHDMQSFTFERNRSYNCDLYTIGFEMLGSGSCQSGCYVQNSWFGASSQFGMVLFGTANEGLVIRYNSFSTGSAPGVGNSSGTVTNVRIVGNSFSTTSTSNCISGATYSYNVWTAGSGCGTGDTTDSLPYVDTSTGSAGDYHLSGTAGTQAADDLVPCGSGDALFGTDYDGDSRPQDSNCDAGSDERNTP